MIIMSNYIIPNKWVGIDYFCQVTGLSKSKVNKKIFLGEIEKEKDGKNVLINLQKYNGDLEAGLFQL